MHALERAHGRLDAVVDASVRRENQTVARKDSGERDLDRGRAKPIAGTAVRAAAEHWKFECGWGDREPSLRSKHVPVGIWMRHPIGQEGVENDARPLRQVKSENLRIALSNADLKRHWRKNAHGLFDHGVEIGKIAG